MATTELTVKIIPNDKGNPPGKLADAELHFTDGPLDGLKLIGFAIWERRGGAGRNVTFPARQYSVNGERRSFALLRPIADTAAQHRIGELVLASSLFSSRCRPSPATTWVAMGLVLTNMHAGREEQAQRLYQALLARQARAGTCSRSFWPSRDGARRRRGGDRSRQAAVEGRDMLFALLNRWWPDFERCGPIPRFADILDRFNARGRSRS